MNGNHINKLFHPIDFAPDSTEELKSSLEKYASQRLIYPGNGFSNTGYIFRGEIQFDVPLQSSLERKWFKINERKNECSTDELLSFEKNLLEIFMESAEKIFDLAKKHKDERPKLPLKEDVFEWLQLKQHYLTGTRFLDFTREIHFSLYFALESFYKSDARLRENGLVIYCFPCIDVENPKTGKDNKSPFNDIPANQPDINLAIGGQMKLECMKKHAETFNKQYSVSKQKQSFGWDRAYNPNPRLSFQEGMLAYPYKTDGVKIKNSEPSWFVQCLQNNPDNPFNLNSIKHKLQPVVIRIPKKSVDCCRKYIEDIRGLTPDKVYLDYGRIGERLKL
jgi:FRG domain